MHLEAAGAFVFGKTVTTPFAFMDPGEDAQPVEPGAHAGRIVVGFGGRCRRWPRRRPP